jgi:hypothetical protein
MPRLRLLALYRLFGLQRPARTIRLSTLPMHVFGEIDLLLLFVDGEITLTVFRVLVLGRFGTAGWGSAG